MSKNDRMPPVDGQAIQPGAVVSPDSATQPESQPQAEQPQVINDDKPAAPQDSDPDEIKWTASEFVAHDKSGGWYVMLSVAAILVAAAAYLVTRDFVSVGVVFVAAIILGYFASHKPRQLEYRMNVNGIEIDKKSYYFNDFRTFSVIPEGAFSSIVLMPLKRFAVPLSIYFAPEDEDKIINLLSSILPFEERRRDAVDSLMHRIRF